MPLLFAWARAYTIKIYMEMGNKFEPSVHADTLQQHRPQPVCSIYAS